MSSAICIKWNCFLKLSHDHCIECGTINSMPWEHGNECPFYWSATNFDTPSARAFLAKEFTITLRKEELDELEQLLIDITYIQGNEQDYNKSILFDILSKLENKEAE